MAIIDLRNNRVIMITGKAIPRWIFIMLWRIRRSNKIKEGHNNKTKINNNKKQRKRNMKISRMKAYLYKIATDKRINE